MTSLDEQLAAAAPRMSASSPELDRELALVLAEAERLARPDGARRRTRLAIGGLAAVGALSLGTAAAAATGVLPWFETAPAQGVVLTSNGSRCELTFGVKGIEHSDHPAVDGTTRATAVAMAERFLEGLDVAGIDVDDATRGLPPRATANSEAGAAETVEEYETYAVMSVVEKRVTTELEQQGLPPEAVGVSMASSCAGEGSE